MLAQAKQDNEGVNKQWVGDLRTAPPESLAETPTVCSVAYFFGANSFIQAISVSIICRNEYNVVLILLLQSGRLQGR